MGNTKIDAESRVFNNVLEARQAASEMGQDVLVHILDMALVEIGGDVARSLELEPKLQLSHVLSIHNAN